MLKMDISIIVPTYNRKETLKRCLDSLSQQDYPKERYEVIVVDDGPRNGTKQMLQEIRGDRLNLRYLSQPHRGPAAARNLGIQEAQGGIIGFTDDDCVLHSDWVRLMVSSQRDNPEITVVGGVTIIPSQRTSLMIGQRLSNGAIQTTLKGRETVIFFPTCNVSLKRQIFDYHRFNENFPFPGGEDLDFFWRLFKDKYHFMWEKSIRVTHHRDDTFRSFIRQAYSYGRGNLLVQHLHQDQPLLKELKTGVVSFWIATVRNFIKIPRFAYHLGRNVIETYTIKDGYKKISIYSYFVIHKIVYLLGNIFEFLRLRKDTVKQSYGPPGRLIVDVTHSCNLACRICEIWKSASPKEDIDTATIKRILFQAQQLDIQEVCLTGGEPLLRADIFEIFDYAKMLKITPLGIISNGILVERHMEKLRPYLFDNSISMNISLESLNPDTHDYLRNSDIVWHASIKALRELSSMKKRYPQVNFNVTSIILNQNLEELLDVAKFIQSLQANSIQFQPVLSNNITMPDKQNSPFWIPATRIDLLDRTIDTLIRFKKENPDFVRNSVRNLALMKKYYRRTINHRDVHCASAYRTVLMTNTGKCTTCFSSFGDIKRLDLIRILQGEERVKAHRQAKRCSSPCLLTCFCDSI